MYTEPFSLFSVQYSKIIRGISDFVSIFDNLVSIKWFLVGWNEPKFRPLLWVWYTGAFDSLRFNVTLWWFDAVPICENFVSWIWLVAEQNGVNSRAWVHYKCIFLHKHLFIYKVLRHEYCRQMHILQVNASVVCLWPCTAQAYFGIIRYTCSTRKWLVIGIKPTGIWDSGTPVIRMWGYIYIAVFKDGIGCTYLKTACNSKRLPVEQRGLKIGTQEHKYI